MMSLQKAASRFLLLWRASILLASSSSSPSARGRKEEWGEGGGGKSGKVKYQMNGGHLVFNPETTRREFSPMLWFSSSWSMKTWSRTKLSSSFCRVLSGLKTRGWRPSLPPETSWWLKIISRSQRSMNACTTGTGDELWPAEKVLSVHRRPQKKTDWPQTCLFS